MSEQAAAEARKVASEFQPVSGRSNMEYAVPGTVEWCSRARVALRNAATAIESLSARLAQAERERDEALKQRDYDYARFSEAKRALIDESKVAIEEKRAG